MHPDGIYKKMTDTCQIKENNTTVVNIVDIKEKVELWIKYTKELC